jgi:hypothetical protein
LGTPWWRAAERIYDDRGFHGHRISGLRAALCSLISRLRIETSPRTNTEWDLDYDLKDGRINSSMALVNYHFGPFTMGGGDAFLRVIDTGAGTIVAQTSSSESPVSAAVWATGNSTSAA